MNKTGAVVRIIIWALIALILTGLMLSIIVFRDFSSFINSGISFGFNSFKYKNESEYKAGNTDISENISAIEIHWINGSINVEKYDGKTVSVKETGANDSDDELRYLVRNGRLIIQFRKSGWAFGISRKLNKHLTIKIPENMANDMKSLEIESVSASIDVSDLTIGQTLSLENVSGTVTIKNTDVNKLDIETVSGDVIFDGSLKELDSESVSANTNISTKIMPNKIDFDTVSGDIELALPENSGFTVDIDSVSGKFNCTFSTSRIDDKYIYGDGSSDFNIDSVSGNVKITKYLSIQDQT